MRKGIMGFAAVLILLFVLSSCGGDDSSLSQAEYEQQLELVCNETLRERTEFISMITRELEEQPNQNLTPDDQAENLLKLTTEYEEMTEAINELGLPDQNPEKVEELIQAQEEAAAKVKAAPLAAVGSLDQAFEKPNELAEGLGVQSCTL